MQNVNGIFLPEGLIQRIKAEKDLGNMVSLILSQTGPIAGACKNCYGDKYLTLAVYDGPLMAPPKKGVVFFTKDEAPKPGWYQRTLKTYPCPVCQESEIGLMRQSCFEESGLLFEERNWGLHYLGNDPGKADALAAAAGLLEAGDTAKGWVFLYGQHGRGKTGLLKAVIAGFCKQGIPARYVTAERLLMEFKATFSGPSEETEGANTELAVLNRYARCVLAIDEVDRVSASQWAQSSLFTLLDQRYSIRNVYPSLFATNAIPGAMGSSFSYLESRAKDGQRFVVGGRDLRGANVQI